MVPVLRRVEELVGRQVSSVTLHPMVERLIFASRTRELVIVLEDRTRMFLPKNHRGPDPITETSMRPIAAQVDGSLQKQVHRWT